MGELELQGAFAGVAKARAAEIIARSACGIVSGQRCIDSGVHLLGEAGAVIVIQHQKGTSWDFAMRDISTP